jgi:hypothetical protein
MINNDGVIYPIIEVFNFHKEPKEVSKPMRRYLYISPTFLQKTIDEEKSGLEDLNSVKDYDITKIKLGIKEKSVWGQDYKIRLTSKRTGKKIDINVKFSYKGITKEERFD